MSALPPKADIRYGNPHVRFVPEADIYAWLFDSTVRAVIPRSEKLRIFNIPDSAP